jgi:hypothetical protein
MKLALVGGFRFLFRPPKLRAKIDAEGRSPWWRTGRPAKWRWLPKGTRRQDSLVAVAALVRCAHEKELAAEKARVRAIEGDDSMARWTRAEGRAARRAGEAASLMRVARRLAAAGSEGLSLPDARDAEAVEAFLKGMRERSRLAAKRAGVRLREVDE